MLKLMAKAAASFIQQPIIVEYGHAMMQQKNA